MSAHPLARGGPLDGENFTVLPGAMELPLIIACDHASNLLPEEYGELGLSRAVLNDHWAWDLGAWATLLRVASALRVTVIASQLSRLLIDCNRARGQDSLVPGRLGEVLVPGNSPLPRAELEGRIGRYYKPYHAAVDRVLSAYQAIHGRRLVFFTFHSFTGSWPGQDRGFELGVLHDEAGSQAAEALARRMSAAGLSTRLNEPYSGMRGEIFTAHDHGSRRGLVYFETELNQSVIADEAGRKRVADVFIEVLPGFVDEVLAGRDQR